MDSEKKRSYLTKQLNMVQTIIDRMGRNSFLIKGWAISIIAGVFAISSKRLFPNSLSLAIFLILILVLFWLLDSYYLYEERIFRNMYNNLVKEFNDEQLISNKSNLFEIDPSKVDKDFQFYSIMFSKTEIPYLITIIAIIMVHLCIK